MGIMDDVYKDILGPGWIRPQIKRRTRTGKYAAAPGYRKRTERTAETAALGGIPAEALECLANNPELTGDQVAQLFGLTNKAICTMLRHLAGK